MRAPRSLLTLCVLAALGCSLPAQAAYETNFDALPAAPAGTALQGVDGFFLPVTTPASSDFAIHTYTNNSLGIPTHQFGGPNFIAALSTASGPATTQRLSAFVADCEVHVEFDICVRYTSTVAPTRREIGGLSLQPQTTATSAGIAAQWSTAAGVMPTTWDADFLAGPSATLTQVPNPLWQGLALDVWHRWDVRSISKPATTPASSSKTD